MTDSGEGYIDVFELFFGLFFRLASVPNKSGRDVAWVEGRLDKAAEFLERFRGMGRVWAQLYSAIPPPPPLGAPNIETL